MKYDDLKKGLLPFVWEIYVETYPWLERLYPWEGKVLGQKPLAEGIKKLYSLEYVLTLYTEAPEGCPGSISWDFGGMLNSKGNGRLMGLVGIGLTGVWK